MRIRELGNGELDKIEHLGAAFWKEQEHPGRYDWEFIKRNLRALDTISLVVEGDNDRIHGVITGLVHPYLMTGETILSELWWFVDESARELGLGKQLLGEFLAKGKSRGCKTVHMVTLAKLPGAEAVMEKMDFKRLETHWIKGL